ncbi:efflux RND transporter periplasmic adaptor subunit [Dokdonella sp. MW10]|uniref:efflux RND transporter periplasmic adaptor subunit n=1 Tax=Dokdonella sp. MW10 TaxID=2992926 RepID=UPI003F7E02F0
MTTRSTRKPSTTKRMIIMILIVGILLFVLIGWNVMGNIMMQQAAQNMPVPPQTVSSTKAGMQPWQPEQGSVGSLRAVRGADLAFDVGGIVTKVNVKSGEVVKEGQLLVELNAEDIVAQQRQLEANTALLKTELDRAKQQLAYKGISQAEYDSAAANLKAAQAGVAQQQALVGKRQLRAPFSGRAGIVTLTPGTYLNAGTAVVTVQQLDPVFVDFTVPQRNLGELQVGQKLMLTLDAFPDRTFEGQVSAISPKLETATRNAQVEASVPNPDEALKPGMFANVAVQVGSEESFLTLPQTAVTFNPYGETVFLVKASDKKNDNGEAEKPTAQSVFVTTGSRRGDQIAILSGIKEGDEVVTSGQLKLKNGTPLIIDNSKQPANEAKPTPQEQ